MIYIYVEDEKGNTLKKDVGLNLRTFSEDETYDENTYADQGLTFLSSNPVVYGRLRTEE